MPPWSVSKDPLIAQPVGYNLAYSGGVNISGTSANTKSDYGELTPSTPVDVDGVHLFIATDVGGANTQTWLVDLAIGSAGSEIVIVENIPVTAKRGYGLDLFLPISLPSGVRLAVRCQSLLTGANPRGLYVAATLFPRSYTKSNQNRNKVVTTYGASVSDSGGVQIDTGGTIHTKSGWVEITSSVVHRIRNLYMFLNLVNDAAAGAGNFLIDVGIGTAGNEVPILQNMGAGSSSGSDGMFPPVIGPIPVNIPEGTRLSVRAQSSILDSGNRRFDVVLMGVS